MAPPRRGAVADDSRSEASSGTREPKGKGRRTGNGSAATREAKGASNAAVTSAPAQNAEDQRPKVPWSEMPLEILHSYRHAYKLNTPSAFTNDYSHLLLSNGIGLRSPTSIAVRRANLRKAQEANGNSAPMSSSQTGFLTSNGVSGKPHPTDQGSQNGPSKVDERKVLHQIIGQDRVDKKQLAQAVRKHFNNAGLGEQEAISRFLYKVREEGRGREFRLRFQP